MIYNRFIMKNHVLQINQQNTLLHRSNRKIVWFALPSLKPIHKFYSKSKFISFNKNGELIIADEGSLTFATIALPPLALRQFQQEFVEYNPIGGFGLTHLLVLYENHSITFFNRLPKLSKAYIIEVMQQISYVEASREEKVLGVTVKQQNNIIFIWDLGEFSNKPKQQITVADKIIKWQFYAQQMIVIMTKKHLRVYYPSDDWYRIQFYIQIPDCPIDFCLLDRPKTNDHTGRRIVYPIAFLCENGKLHIYQLYDMDKRLKFSLANSITVIQVHQKAQKIISGYEKQKKQIVFVLENSSHKPFVIITNQKLSIIDKIQYQPQLSTNINKLEYRKGYTLIQQQQQLEHMIKKQMGEEMQKEKKLSKWKLFQGDDFEDVMSLEAEGAILGNNRVYTLEVGSSITYYRKENQFKQKLSVEFKCPANLFILEEQQNCTYFIAGIKIYKLDLNENTMKTIGFTIRNQKFKLIEVRTYTRSLLYKVGSQYYLMQYHLQNHKITAKNIRASPNKMISLRNGRWAETSTTSIMVGQNQKKLTTFDLLKFFKTISSQNDVLYEYQVYWTTHDGIILIVRNYLFVLQLIETSDGYILSPIKRFLNYLHHRFNPDASLIQVLDPREFVIREDNRIIKLGSKLGNYISQDPYALPDTLLNRQLAMRKHYPPYHPKIIHYLIQLGSFKQISKLMKKLYQWIQDNKNKGGKHLSQLYEELGCQFFCAYKQEDDERVIVSMVEQEEISEIQMMRNLCESILEDPYQLELQENGGLILQSQVQSLIFKDENSRSMDYFSSIVLTQFKTPLNKKKSFETMHIAYMLHSINKQQAITILQPEKLDWDWIKKYSIIMWYDNKQQIKKWVEQIAANQYRKDKEPFDCLLWYVLAGKKNLLATLFKSQQYNSKEHLGVFKFLQKDLNDQKSKMAANKNAYALLDKKRYYHALAFFILGQQIDVAVSNCLEKLKDINLAMLICRTLGHIPTRIYQTINQEGDIWLQHILKFYKAEHIDSFNCLFQQENTEKMANWDIQLKLTCFHPSLSLFAEMIEKSIPVRRELEEQKMKKQAQNQSNDIFDSFFGQESSSTQIQQTVFQQKILMPQYEKLSTESAKYFLQNRCPQLALMIDHENWRAKRAYNLSRFMLLKTITPTVQQIAQQLQDTLSIISQKLQFNHSPLTTIKQHYKKALKSLKQLQLNSLHKTEKKTIGESLHFCYLSEKIIEMEIKQEECQTFINKYMKPLQIMARILISLELNYYGAIQQLFEITKQYYQKNVYRKVDEQFWMQIKVCYGKLPQLQKEKIMKVIDSFEQTFYKYTFKRQKVQQANQNFKIGVQNAWTTLLKRTILGILFITVPQNIRQHQIFSHLSLIFQKNQSVIKRWIENDAINEINQQIQLMYTEGAVSKLKVNYLNEYLGEKFEGVCRAILCMKVKQKIPSRLLYISKASRSAKGEDNNSHEAIEIFRNKSQNLQSFAINKNQGLGLELALLFKRNLRKLEICESLINRNRTNDGLNLVHEETSYNIDHNIDFDNIFHKSYPPIIEQTLKNVLNNRNQYDGRGALKGSTKRGSPQYLKPLDNIPYFDFNDVNTIQCHHFLPVYLLGGKSVIDICEFGQLKNYNRIKCPGMGDIIKLRSFEQRVSALDSNGNLSTYSFDSKIDGNCVFSLKKSGITDFCLMSPTIYAFCNQNSIQVMDSLIHPKRQCVFKIQTSQPPICIDSLLQKKVIACRKSDLQIYDFRMDIQENGRDITGNGNVTPMKESTKARCITTNHKNKILVGRQDGRVRIIDYANKDKDYEIKCSRGGNQQKQYKGYAIEQIQVMGNTAVVRNLQGGIYLIDQIQ